MKRSVILNSICFVAVLCASQMCTGRQVHLQHPASLHTHVGCTTPYAPNPDCDPLPWNVTDTEMTTETCDITWGGTAGGTLSTQAGALWWNLKGTAHASVDCHNYGTSTYTNSITQSWNTFVAPCKKLRFQFKVLTGFASVDEFETWDHKIVCHEVANGQPWITSYCNPGTLSGNAVGICDRDARFVPDGDVEGCDCCNHENGDGVTTTETADLSRQCVNGYRN